MGSFRAACAIAAYLAASPFVLSDELESAAETESERAEVVAKFLGDYCLQCHDAAAAEGEREFESFQFPLDSVQRLITANEIIDQVTLKEMPPEDSEQPTDEERLAVVTALRNSIELARKKIKGTGARTVMRRLSNREYENTLAALFDRRVDTLGLTADFPKKTLVTTWTTLVSRL